MVASNQSGPQPRHRRIILKISGEVLRNTQGGEPIDPNTLKAICEEVKKVYDIGVQIGLVIGG
ncbi:MAG: UMP kinase, partial [Verrucomicrobiota bacterium]|nr:UMP kinase [Verrucomicrobiota bacterium]